MSRVNNGADLQARQMGGATVGFTGTGATVTYTATALTDTAAAFTASSGGPPQQGGLVGAVVVSGNVWGSVITSTATVLTVDMWHNATAPATVGTTPSANATYIVLPASAPAWWIGLSTATRAIVAADAFLTNDGTTVSEVWNAGGGLNRALASFSHTTGTSTYQIAKTYTANGSDPASTAVNRIGVFQHQVNASPTTTTTGQMLFESNVTNPPTLVSGDQITITETVTI